MKLDIGGYLYKTSLETLLRVPGSLFYKIFEEDFEELKQEDQSVFFDRPGKHFEFILNYLRNPEEKLALPCEKEA